MSTPLIVYSFRRCPFAMRVRLTLHEKGLTFETIEEDLKNFSPELLRLHPEAKVPVLVHGSVALYESAIITEYLEEAFPASLKLMPQSAVARAQVRLWTHWCDTQFKPTIDRLKYGVSRFSVEECAGSENRIQSHLQKLEDRLAQAAWLVEGSYSLADVHLFPFCRQLFQMTPPPSFFANYPAVNRWADAISLRPAFLKTMEKGR